ALKDVGVFSGGVFGSRDRRIAHDSSLTFLLGQQFGVAVQGASSKPDRDRFRCTTARISTGFRASAAGGRGVGGRRQIAGPAQVGGTYTCFGQFEFHLVGGCPVTGKGSGNGSDLLVSGGHQEGWGAPVAFPSYDVEVGIGVREDSFAVGRDGAAAMEFWIDQWAQLPWRFNDLIHVQTQFREDRQIWSESCG